MTNGLSVLIRSGSDRFSRCHCSFTANLKGSAFLCSSCAFSPDHPLYLSDTNTNFASMYRIWSSNESPMPSRPIALTTLRVQNEYATKCFTSSTDGPTRALKPYFSPCTSKNRSHLRSITLACADCLTGSPKSCARSSSPATCCCFRAAVARCEAASVSAALAASSPLPALWPIDGDDRSCLPRLEPPWALRFVQASSRTTQGQKNPRP